MAQHLTILTIGSRGDIQPYIALGLGLRQKGYRVRVATHAEYEAFVRHYDLEFAPVAGNPKTLLEGATGALIRGLGWFGENREPPVFRHRSNLCSRCRPTRLALS